MSFVISSSLFSIVSNYIKTHERLILCVLAVGLLWGVSGKVENVIAAHDKSNLTAVQATLAAQVDKNAAQAAQDAELAKQEAQQAAQYKALAAQTQQQNVALAQANAALTKALSEQQKKDTTMPLPDLAQRWASLIKVDGLTFSSAGDLQITDPAARATVLQLEQVQPLQQQLSNTTYERANDEKLLAACNANSVTLNQQVSGLNAAIDGKNLQIADADKACQGQIKLVKDDARKSKRKWFEAGVVVGFIGRQVIKSLTGF